MKCRIIVFLFSLSSILYSQSLAYKNKICLAIMERESYYGKYMFNPEDTASQVYFGMRRCYVSEVNRICDKRHINNNFKDSDRFDYDRSVKMFFIYNNYWVKDWDYKTVAIVHSCGTTALDSIKRGQRGEDYWKLIQKVLLKFEKNGIKKNSRRSNK
jgi:hypothetical protein